MEGVSSTLKNILVELRIPKLPSALIGSIISSYIMKQRTHLQVAMSNLVKRTFLIEELHHYGITSTYDEYLQLKGSAAFAVRQKEASWVLNNSKKLIQAVGDNFDAKLSTPNGLKQTHSMALILTQESQDGSKSHCDETIKRLTKREIKAIQVPELEIARYQGPAKPLMPVIDAKYNVLSLKVLCRQAISVKKANDLDINFVNAILKEDSTPEYNGFNTAHTRNAGCSVKPLTSVTYLPLININPSDPDTILTSMYKVRPIHFSLLINSSIELLYTSHGGNHMNGNTVFES